MRFGRHARCDLVASSSSTRAPHARRSASSRAIDGGHDRRRRSPGQQLQTAASNGRRRRAVRLWDIDTFVALVREGNLELLERGREEGLRLVLSVGSCAESARAGQLEVLKYLRRHGCPWDEGTCRNAAKGGHLDVLKWAHENRCPWDPFTCSDAAEGGHLDVLKWARAHQCPWQVKRCRGVARRNGHDHVLAWIDEQEKSRKRKAEGKKGGNLTPQRQNRKKQNMGVS